MADEDKTEKTTVVHVTKNGISAAGLLLVVLITLKVTGLTELSWLWITAPIWIGPAFLAAVVACVAAMLLLVAIGAWIVS